ncbi:MAG: sulfotransferase [Crocinitomicaceae bacterium]|nr:sulfotransferase [Crocinitomicaceae bacterium]
MSNLVFHIGHHKTGSTWMQQHYFQAEDQFHLLNDTKLPWDDVLCREIIINRSPEKCQQLIEERKIDDKINVISAERLAGHPISGGFDMEPIAKCLHQVSPTAKVIIVTRPPQSFVKSAYKQLIREGYRGKLQDFLFFNYWKTAGATKAYFLQQDAVSTYTHLFGEQNVLELEFENFKEDKSSFITKINQFLGADVNIETLGTEEVVGQAFSTKRTKAMRYLNRFRKTEYNQHPSIALKQKTLIYASYLLTPFFTKRNLIDNQAITNFLND